MAGVLDMFSDVRTADTFDDGGADGSPPPFGGFDPTDYSLGEKGDGLSCEVCGTPLTWAGRGRKPKFCADHRKGGGGPATGVTGKSQLTDRRTKAIATDLQHGLGELAGTLVGGMPVTATVTLMQGPGAIDAFVKIAANYPAMLDGLEKAAKLVPWIEVGKFGCSLGLAAMVDLGQASPYGLAGEYLGVAKAAQTIGWQPPKKKTKAEPTTQQDAPPAFKLVEGFTVRN